MFRHYRCRHRNQWANDSCKKNPFTSAHQIDRTHRLALECFIVPIFLFKRMIYVLIYTVGKLKQSLDLLTYLNMNLCKYTFEHITPGVIMLNKGYVIFKKGFWMMATRTLYKMMIYAYHWYTFKSSNFRIGNTRWTCDVQWPHTLIQHWLR